MPQTEVLPVAPVRAVALRSRMLPLALLAYVVFAGALAVCQRGYINADFIAYATIARRCLTHSGPWISGCWAPLFSWAMMPGLYLGLSDLLAGRLVLLLAGALYVAALYGLARRCVPFAGPGPRFVTTGVVACAVIQAAVWANFLLDPDLLATSLLFACFYFLLDPALAKRPAIAALAGLVGGLAYLAKGYMLPFLLLFLPVVLLLRYRHAARTGTPYPLRVWLAATLLFVLGLAVVAGPWIGVLSHHYHHLTFSTAGSSNHANVSPANFGHDPMWNQGLAADFIADPALAPDWSPSDDAAHFRHQIRVCLYNARTSVEHLALWIFGLAVAAVFWWRRRALSENLSPAARLGVQWCLAATVLYVAGYSYIDAQARYVVPVAAPLLCLAAFLLLATAWPPLPEAKPRRFPWATPVRAALILTALLALQDGDRIARIVRKHPQSTPLSTAAQIARALHQAGLPPGPWASNNYHAGLVVAYADDRVASYLGAPRLDPAASFTTQLDATPACIYLRWLSQPRAGPAPTGLPAYIPPPPWQLLSTLDHPDRDGTQIEVYARPPAP